MKPTEEQLNSASSRASMLTIGIGKEHRLAYGRELIEAWESIRPPCPDCGAVKAALPEWIPVKERLPDEADLDENNEVLHLSSTGDVVAMSADLLLETDHWMRCATLAALPKRPAPVKVEPTAEELEEAEAEKAWLKWGDAGERHSFMGGWKAARAGRYCVGLNSGTVSHDDSTVDYGKAR